MTKISEASYGISVDCCSHLIDSGYYYLGLDREASWMTTSTSTEACYVADLPTELLERIFIQLRDELVVDPPVFGPSTHSWLRLCEVCKHWREVILKCAALWSHITARSPSPTHVTTMVNRSKQFPLTVNLGPRSRKKGLDLLDQGGAIQRLVAASLGLDHQPPDPPTVDVDRIHANLDANSLRELSLAYEWPSGEWMNHPARIPPFANGYLPNLTKFKAKAARFMNTLPFLRPTLSYLDLCLIERPQVDQLASALEAMPQLQVLALSFSFPSPADKVTLSTIRLPCLRELKIIDLTAYCKLFLESLLFPTASIQTLDITCRPFACGTRQKGEELQHLPTIMSRLVECLNGPITTLSSRRREDVQLELCGWTDPPGLESRPHIRLAFAGCEDVEDVEVFTMILDQVPTQDVRTLYFGNVDIPGSPRENWRYRRLPQLSAISHVKVLYRFALVEDLTVDRSVAVPLGHALTLCYSYVEDDGSEEQSLSEQRMLQNQPILFPQLRRLTVSCAEVNPCGCEQFKQNLRGQLLECQAKREMGFDISVEIKPEVDPIHYIPPY